MKITKMQYTEQAEDIAIFSEQWKHNLNSEEITVLIDIPSLSTISKLSINDAARYADPITIYAVSKGYWAYLKNIHSVKCDTVNECSVGNLAYVIKYSQDPELTYIVRERYQEIQDYAKSLNERDNISLGLALWAVAFLMFTVLIISSFLTSIIHLIWG